MAELLRGDVGWVRPRPRRSVRLLAVGLVLTLLVPFGPLLIHRANAITGDRCYAVTNLPSASSELWSMERTTADASTNTGTRIGPLRVSGVKALAYDPFSGTLYAAHGGTLSQVDVSTGVATAVGTFGSATGNPGTETIDNVIGMAVDPFAGTIYAVEERNGVHAMLFVVDPTNPASSLHVDDAFGPDLDYVKIDDDESPTFGLPNAFQLHDIAVDPADGALQAVTRLGGGTEHVLTLDRSTGEVDDLRTLVEGPDVDASTDMGGLDFHNEGALYGQTGSTSGAPRTMFQIVESATNLTGRAVGQYPPSPATDDFESLACLTAASTTISGTIYRDDDRDGIHDGGEPAHDQPVTVSLYRSLDGGMRDPGDPLVATAASAADGSYSFELASTGDFFVVPDRGDLPADATGWHPAELAVTATTSGADIAYRMATVGGTVTCTSPETGDCAGDPPVADTTVSLQQAGSEVAADSSDSAGVYDVVGLAPGAYDVVVTPPDGYEVTSAPGSVTVDTAGQDVDGVDIQLRRLQADLFITKTPDNPSPRPGETVTYTITVTNDGPDDATGVTVVDQLAGGVSSVDCGTGTYDATASTCTWEVGTLAVTATETVTVSVVVEDPTDATDTATGSSDAEDPDTSDDTATSTPQTVDLSVTKAVSDDAPLQGQVITYEIEVLNAGPETATNIVVEEAFPTGLTETSAFAGTGTYDTATDTWTIPSLPPGTGAALAITTTVTGAGPYTNTAEVVAVDQYDVDSTPGNHDTAPDEDDSDTVTVTPQRADLSLTKAVDDPTPDAGEVVTFTLTLDNAGPDPATNVQVEDTLPTGLSFVTGSLTASTGSATESGGTITWDVSGPLVTGTDVATLTFQATAGFDAAAGVQNTATVTGLDQFDPDDPPATGSVAVDAVAADVSVSLSGPTTPDVGDTVSVTVTAGNGGPDPATGVTVTIGLDPGLTFGAVPADFAVSADGTTATWTLPAAIGAGGNTLETFEVVVGTGAVDGADIDASITATEPDPDATNDSTTRTVDARDVDLQVGKTADGGELARPQVGDTVTFRIVVGHTASSADDATGVEVTDRLPEGYAYSSHTAPAGTTVTVTDVGGRDEVTWDVGELPRTDTATLDVVATVGTERLDRQTNTATITAVDQHDTDPSNDADSADVDPVDVDVQVTKTFVTTTGATRPEVGERITFTVTVTNANDGTSTDGATATGVEVSDPPTSGLTDPQLVSVDGSVNLTTGTWTVGDVPADGSRSLSYSVLVDAGDLATVHEGVTNTATVTAVDQYDRDASNDSYDRSVDPLDADGSIDKQLTAGSATPQVGDEVEFTVTVTNAGPDPAPDIVVEDTLAPGLQLVSATSGDAADTVTTAGSTTTWQLGDALGPAGTATLTVVVEVVGEGHAGTANTAEVVAVGGNRTFTRYDPDSTPGDGTGDDHDQVALDPRDADLRLVKTVDEPAPRFGDQVVFTVTVTNDGPDTAQDVEVVDTLPASLTLDGAVAGQGAYDPASGVWTVGDVMDDGSATLTLSVTTTAGGSHTNVAEVTDVLEFDPDSTPGNHDVAPEEDDSDTATVTVDDPASLSGAAWDDLDGDGVRDVGEDGLTNVEITLTSDTDATFTRTTTTDTSGAYTFTELPRDDYTVAVTDPPASPYEPSVPDPATTTVTVFAGEDVTDVDFGYWRPATITGLVWYDVDGDGTFDLGETAAPPAPVTVELYADTDGDGLPEGAPLRSVTLDTSDGAYTFDELAPGHYVVVVPETFDDRYVLTTDNTPDAVTGLEPAQTAAGVDFGYDDYHPAVSITPGTTARVEAATDVVYAHRITNDGNVGDSYDLTATSSQGWVVQLWEDVDADGSLDTSVDRLLSTPADTGPVTKEGGRFDLLAVVEVPTGTARGTVGDLTVTVTGWAEPQATDQATDTTTVIAPRIEVDKTSSTATGDAVPGGTIDYRIEVRNVDDGISATALDVHVDDELADPSHGTIDGSTIAVDGDTSVPDSFPVALGDLAPGDLRVVTFQVRVTRPLADGTVTVNTATATADNAEGDLLVDQDSTADTVASSASPQLTKSAIPVSGTTVDPADTITYQLVVSNRADATDSLRGVTVTDAEPDTTTDYVPGSAAINGAPVADDGTNPFASGFALGDLPPDATVTLAFAVEVHDPIADGTVIVNVAEATGTNTGPLYASVSHVAEVDPGVSLTPARSGTVEPPATMTYAHVLRNEGDVTDTYDLTATSDHGWTTEIRHDLDGDGQVDGGEPVISSRTLAPGQVSRLLVTVAVPAGTASGTVDTVTVVATSRTEPAVSSQVFDATTVVTGELEVRKTADPSSSVVNPGMDVVYTIEVENVGGAPARDVVLTDDTPDSTTYRPGTATWDGVPVADGTSGDRNPLSTANGGLDLGDLAAGTTATVRFTVRVHDPLADDTLIVNVAEAVGDPDLGAAGSVTQLVRSSPVFDLDKTASPTGTVEPRERITYTLTVANLGNEAATGVVLTDPTPAGTSYVPGSTSVDGTAVADDGTSPLAASNGGLGLPDLPVGGAPVTVSLAVTVDDPVSGGTVINNEATVASAEGVSAPSQRVRHTVNVEAGVTVGPDRSSDVVIPGVAAYGHDVTNTGNVTDTYGLDATSSEGWSTTLYADEDGDGRWDSTTETTAVTTTGPVPPGGRFPLIAVVDVPADAVPGTVDTTTVRAGSTADPAVDDAATDRTRAVAPALRIVKNATPSGDQVNAGQVITYNVTVRNVGGAPATGVVVVDDTPQETSYVPGSANVGTTSIADATGSDPNPFSTAAGGYAIGELPGGETVNFGFEVRVSTTVAVGTDIVNTATATADHTAEPDRATRIHTVTSGPVLDLLKSADPTLRGPVTAGERIAYEVAVRNVGQETATGVRVTDDTPIDTVYVEGSATVDGVPLPDGPLDPNPFSSQYAGHPVGDLPPDGAVTTIGFAVEVVDPVPDGGTITNVATAASAEDATAQTPLVEHDVDVHPAVTLGPDGTRAVLAGGTAVHPLTVTNTGDVTDVYTFSGDNSRGWTLVLRADPDGDGQVDAGEPEISATGSLAPAASYTATLAVTAPDGTAAGTTDTTVVRATSTGDGTVDDGATLTTRVVAGRLGLTKSASPQTVTPGSRTTYTLTVENEGDARITGVALTDATPAGTTYVSGSTRRDGRPVTDRSGGDGNPLAAGLTLGALGPGDRTVVTFEVDVMEDTDLEVVVNVAQVTADDAVPDRAGTTQPISRRHGLDLAPPSEVELGSGPAVHAHTLTNIGDLADEVLVTATSDLGFPVVVHRDADGDGRLDDADPVLAGPVALAPGASTGLLVVVTVPDGTPGGTEDLTTVTATSLGDPDVVVSVEDVTRVIAPALVITKEVDPNVSAAPGTELTFTIRVANDGNAGARDLVVTDPTPAGTTYVAGSTTVDGTSVPDAETAPGADATPDPADPDANPLDDRNGGVGIATLDPGEAAVVRFRSVVREQVVSGTELSNVAFVTSPETGMLASPTVTVQVLGSSSLAVAKGVDAPGEVIVGTVVTWAVQVTNLSTEIASDVTVSDDLPVGVAYLPGTTTLDGQPVIDVGAGIVGPGVQIGPIAAGATRLVTFQTVATGEAQLVENVAGATHGGSGAATVSNAVLLGVNGAGGGLDPFPSTLPRTGAPVVRTLGTGLLLALTGWSLLFAARREDPPEPVSPTRPRRR